MRDFFSPKHFFTLLFAGALLLGCQPDANPVGQATDVGTVSSNQAGGHLEGSGGPTLDDPPSGGIWISLGEYDTVKGDTVITKTVSATKTTTLKVKVMYYKGKDKVSSVSAQLKFFPGTVNQDMDITLRMDPSNLGFEFLPHGTTFNRPVLLTLDTYGLDLTGFEVDTDLWYKENGEWLESYQGRLIKVFPQNGKLMVNDVELRHFSQYIFGRRY